MTPKKKARKAVKARICETIRSGGAKPAQDITPKDVGKNDHELFR